jgi:Zn-dependent protease
MTFSKSEIRDLSIAWLVLGFCFSFRYLFSGLGAFATFLVVALIGIGTGFVFHELSHKLVAQRFGYLAEFRLWKVGLIIALASAIISLGQLLFFAPGAVYVSSYSRSHEQGLIAAAGPLANIILAPLFYLLSYSSGFLGLIGQWGFIINLWLAAFNLLPMPPLDGRKIYSWNSRAWIALAVVSWGSLALAMFGII